MPSYRNKKSLFRTDHLMGDLITRSARGGVFTAVAQFLKFLLQLASTMILARLLTPEDFGLVAMVMVFSGLISTFREFGLSEATVQRQEITHEQVSTLFWINSILGVILMFLAMALSPLVAGFYQESALVAVMMVISITFLSAGLGAQHFALLRRQMRFQSIALIDIGAMAFGVLLGISVAYIRGDYWALVSMTTGQAIAAAVLPIVISGWRPGKWQFDGSIGELVRFGGTLTGYRFVNYVSRNADNLILGKSCGPTELGIYSRAYALLAMPLEQINGPIAAVAIPTLSRLQATPKEFGRFYVKLVQVIAYISMPFVVLLAVLADEVVYVLLGPQWQDAANIFRIFAAFVLIQNVLGTTGWFCRQWAGRQDFFGGDSDTLFCF